MLQGKHSAIFSTFIKRPVVIKIFVLSTFEWPLYTGFIIGHLYASLLYSIFVSKSTFSKNSFRNTIRLSNSLDPDQAWHIVGPDLFTKASSKIRH